MCEIVRFYVENVLLEGWMCLEEVFYVNSTGCFVIGGPDSDTGLIGRKIIVDIYGGSVFYGGGAFLGKDLSKVDCSGAYVVCYFVKNVVEVGFVDRCII